MANETKIYKGTTKALETSGASLANNAITAIVAAYDRAVDGLGYPDADIILVATFATAPTVNTTLDLYAAEQDVKSTNDETAPTTTYKPRYICSFPVNAVTTAQYIKRSVRNMPEKALYSLHNNATGQTVSAAWTLDITPTTRGPV